MIIDRLITYFMPAAMRNNTGHLKYNEYRIVVSACLIGLSLLVLFPPVLLYLDKNVTGYLINGALILTTLYSIRIFGHYRIPMTLMALVTYVIIYGWIATSGFIFSPNLSILHMYLLCAVLADRRYGWLAILLNLMLLSYIYHQTKSTPLYMSLPASTNPAFQAWGINCLITVFLGGFLAYLQFDQEKDRLKIKQLQEQKINMLDEVIRVRSEQISSMRETMASNFHDETGNMLSAIVRQASLLKQRYGEEPSARKTVESIIHNSNSLYASSKDFLWHLHHNSDDPIELFEYLTAHAQFYYNQFDIAFSATREDSAGRQLAPSAALDIIYIFKEAMTNVVKHADAQEVIFDMRVEKDKIIYGLWDNGGWKIPTSEQPHYGIENMKRRCLKNGFEFGIVTATQSTTLTIRVPTFAVI